MKKTNNNNSKTTRTTKIPQELKILLHPLKKITRDARAACAEYYTFQLYNLKFIYMEHAWEKFFGMYRRIICIVHACWDFFQKKELTYFMICLLRFGVSEASVERVFSR